MCLYNWGIHLSLPLSLSYLQCISSKKYPAKQKHQYGEFCFTTSLSIRSSNDISEPHWTASLNCSRDVFKHLPCLLVIADFFITLPFQISRNENLKVEPVEQQVATQERMCVPLIYKYYKSVQTDPINKKNKQKETDRCGCKNQKAHLHDLVILHVWTVTFSYRPDLHRTGGEEVWTDWATWSRVHLRANSGWSINWQLKEGRVPLTTPSFFTPLPLHFSLPQHLQ